MNLKKLGYSTGKVLFPGLNVKVKLDNNQYFSNDGVVEDFNAHVNKLDSAFGRDSLTEKIPDSKIGLRYENHAFNGVQFIKLVNVFWKKRDPVQDIFVSGHESTHALMSFGKENYLLNELKKYNFTFNPFESYSDEDDIADVGGFLGVHKAGYDIVRICRGDDLDFIKEDILNSKKARNSFHFFKFNYNHS
ncbi:MAG: hypothetical protein ABIB43_03175 [archaeon]